MSTYVLEVSRYNLSFKLKTNDTRLINTIEYFIDKYYTLKQEEFGTKGTKNYKRFVSYIKEKNEYYFHIHQFYHLYNFLKKEEIAFNPTYTENKSHYSVETVEMSVKKEWQPRDYQKPVVDFLLEDPKGSKLVSLKTGQGKTFIALYSIAKLMSRLAIVILPIYIDKWVKDILTIHNAKAEDILVIQGSKNLKLLIELAKNNELDNKYIIFSSRTLQEFISRYEENPYLIEEEYGISPIDLFPLLKVGVLLIDETHQHFHAIYKILLHTNVHYHIGLSATLISDNYTVSRIQKLVYPEKNIYGEKINDRYIDVYPIAYDIDSKFLKMIKTTFYGSNKYSHVAFEKSILKRDFLLQKYFNLIKKTIEDYFINEYTRGDKLLIFISTVELGTQLSQYLQNCYPKFIVKRYCEDDPYEHLECADIIVSTIISAGTAVDIKNLRVVIQTVSISSSVANIQSLGRLRKLEDRDVKFCYLYSNQINKQLEYHKKRVELFTPRVAHILHRRSSINLN